MTTPAQVDAYVYGWPCAGARCHGYTSHRVVEFMLNLGRQRVEVVGLCTRCGTRADIPASAIRRQVEPAEPKLDLPTLFKGARRGPRPAGDPFADADDRARTGAALDAAERRAHLAAVWSEGQAGAARKARARVTPRRATPAPTARTRLRR